MASGVQKGRAPQPYTMRILPVDTPVAIGPLRDDREYRDVLGLNMGLPSPPCLEADLCHRRWPRGRQGRLGASRSYKNRSRLEAPPMSLPRCGDLTLKSP